MSGMVGAGAVNNSGIVGKYPTGHILQTVRYTNTTQAASTGNSLVTAISGEISLKYATNKILAHFSTQFVIQTYGGSSNTSGSVYGGFQIVSSGTGVSAETHKWGSYTTNDGLYGYGFSTGSTDEKFIKLLHTAHWYFTPGTTNACAIGLQATGYGDHTMTVNYQGGSTPYFKDSSMVLQEIQI